MVPNAKTNHGQMLACEAVLRCHIEQEVIKNQYLTSSMIALHAYQITWTSFPRYTCNNHLYTSVWSKSVYALSTHFAFMVTYISFAIVLIENIYNCYDTYSWLTLMCLL